MKRIASFVICLMMVLSMLGYGLPQANAHTLHCQDEHCHDHSGATRYSDILGRIGSGSSSAKKAWLPDPYNAIGVQGYYADSGTWNNMHYDFYVYEIYMTIEEAVDAELLYTNAMEKEGFRCEKYEDEYAISYVCFTKNGSAYAELGLYIVDDYGSDCYGWQIVLAVPEDLEFTLGHGSSYITGDGIRCETCTGSRTCSYCIGGRCNYGAGYETCVICDGTDICNICDGKGYW